MGSAVGNALKPLASLKLTVFLFALAVFIVFAGTLAQVDQGVWSVVHTYFRCAVSWIDIGIFFPRSWNIHGTFPFPGGWLIGLLLLINILAAHLIRFQIKASGLRLAAGLITLAVGAVLMWLIVIGAFSKDIAATENAAFWRVLLRLAKGGGAALVLMIACILLFRRRAGIVLLHGGIILMLASEFLTGMYASEGRMRINAGESKNYVELSRHVELAIVDRSAPDVDHVTTVPGKRIEHGGMLNDDRLPFGIQVQQFMRNSKIVDARNVGPEVSNPATVGSGLVALAVPQPEVSGTSTDQKIDVPAAYLTFFDKSTGASLGTYMVMLMMDRMGLPPQTVTVDGRTYDVALRFTRDYKPYSIELLEFHHDTYVGTDKPKNFSSLVRIVDPEKNVDRTVKIWMNNPLRYRGETFYQASFEPGKNLTILQVVRNDGWMLPYLACMIVGAGMSVHFGSNLINFLRKRVAI